MVGADMFDDDPEVDGPAVNSPDVRERLEAQHRRLFAKAQAAASDLATALVTSEAAVAGSAQATAAEVALDAALETVVQLMARCDAIGGALVRAASPPRQMPGE